MRILLVNWAPIWRGAAVGGGVNGYLRHLAPELVRNGHDVTYLFGGLLHSAAHPGCHARRHNDFEGVRVIEIINSPVLAPSASQFREPLGELSAPELEREFARLLGLLSPEIVHWHNLEGFSARCVALCSESGARSVYTLHNYHTLCSQVTLCRGHEKPCTNFEGGLACATCIDAPDTLSERRRREADFEAEQHREIDALATASRTAMSALKHELSWPKRLAVRSRAWVSAGRRLRAAKSRLAPAGLPGRAVQNEADLVPDSPEPRGHGVGPAERTDRAYAKRAGQPLDPAPHPDPSSGKRRSPYGTRRSEMIAMLNRCDAVIAVSDHVREKFIAEGIEPGIIATQRIGTVTADRPVPLRIDAPRARGHLRLVFVGFNHFNKGLPLLLAALEGLPGSTLRRIGLSLYTPDVRSIAPRFRALHPPLAELNIRDGYEHSELPTILTAHDLCYVGSTWHDPLPQTVLESLACGVPVIGSRSGGIPEAIRDSENGILFRANDPASLRSALADAVERHESGAATIMTRPLGMGSHAEQLATIYQELRSETVPPTLHPCLTAT